LLSVGHLVSFAVVKVNDDRPIAILKSIIGLAFWFAVSGFALFESVTDPHLRRFDVRVLSPGSALIRGLLAGVVARRGGTCNQFSAHEHCDD
jgi:hypothetical protein